MKICSYYFFDDIINTKNLRINKIKIDKTSYKNILFYYIGCLTIKDSRYVKLKNVNPLYLIIKNINGYFEKINGKKYLTLVPTNESKKTMKKIWRTIKQNQRSNQKNN